MFRKSWMKQVQAITYMILIVFLYLTLDGNIGGQFSNIETKEVREAGGQFSILKEMNVFPQSSKSEETQEAQYDILIDLTESMLYLFENDKLLKKYPVAQGKVSTPSPVGIWKITSKARNWGSGFGTRWMGLSKPHYGIHGTNNPASIGTAASNGCVRMYNEDVNELFNQVPVGTGVSIY